MVKVITYGTFDMLHYGHLRLLERAKKLGDYLIVGITSDSYDKQRGKINVSQNLIKRIENVKATNLADEIIVEEYDGQKIDDIKKYNVDIFTIGSDWVGKFDYLNEYCKVVYLDRTIGVSSSELRSSAYLSRLALACDSLHAKEIIDQIHYVNGLELTSLCTNEDENLSVETRKLNISSSIDETVSLCDDIYISSPREKRLEYCKSSLEAGKNVLCELPISEKYEDYIMLTEYAKKHNASLSFSLASSSSLAYSHFISLLKSKSVGDNMTLSVTSSLSGSDDIKDACAQSIAPVFDIFGTTYKSADVYKDENNGYYRITFVYDKEIAFVQIGKSLEKNDEIKVTGTNGVCVLNSPWKTGGHISYSKTGKDEPIHFKYDGLGIKYALLKLIKHEDTGIDENKIKAITDIICKL